MPPLKKKALKLPKSVWLIFQHDNGYLVEGSAAVYEDHKDIGDLLDDEVVAHYRLVETKNRPSKEQ